MNWLKLNYVKYGLIMCGVLVVCLVWMHVTGNFSTFEKKSPFELLFVLSPLVIWFLGIKAKKKELKGKMTFKQGWVEGVKISLVFGLISPFIFMFYYLLFNMEILNYVREAYGMPGASDTTAIAVDMAVQFVGAMVMGTVFSVVIAFFLKTKS